MKKIVVLAISLVLLASLPVFASDAKFSGEFTYGGIGGFADDSGNVDNWVNAYADLTLTVDDYNTVLLEFGFNTLTGTFGLNPDLVASFFGGPAPASVPFVYSIGAAKLTTDLGKALGLESFTLTDTAGFFNVGDKEYAKVGGYDNQYVTAAVDADVNGGISLNAGIMSMFNVVYAQSLVGSANEFLIGAYGVFGPVSAEAYYSLMGAAPADGDIGAGLKAKLGGLLGEGLTLDLAASLDFNMDSAAADGLKTAFGLGAAFKMGMFGIFAGLNGNDLNFADGLGLELNVAPLANVGLDLGVFMDLFDGAPQALNSVDASAYYKAGAGTIRLGYLFSDTTAPVVAYGAPTGLTNGGLYATFDIDF